MLSAHRCFKLTSGLLCFWCVGFSSREAGYTNQVKRIEACSVPVCTEISCFDLLTWSKQAHGLRTSEDACGAHALCPEFRKVPRIAVKVTLQQLWNVFLFQVIPYESVQRLHLSLIASYLPHCRGSLCVHVPLLCVLECVLVFMHQVSVFISVNLHNYTPAGLWQQLQYKFGPVLTQFYQVINQCVDKRPYNWDSTPRSVHLKMPLSFLSVRLPGRNKMCCLIDNFPQRSDI